MCIFQIALRNMVYVYIKVIRFIHPLTPVFVKILNFQVEGPSKLRIF